MASPQKTVNELVFTDMTTRALAAYWLDADHATEHPERTTSGECVFQGRPYVVLATTSRVLAVYRIRANGYLRRLKRWPREFNVVFGPGY